MDFLYKGIFFFLFVVLFFTIAFGENKTLQVRSGETTQGTGLGIGQQSVRDLTEDDRAEKSQMFLQNVQAEIMKVLTDLDETLRIASQGFYSLLGSEKSIRQTLSSLSMAHPGIVDVSFVDENGNMAFVEPSEYRAFEGKYIGDQEQVIRLFETKKPVLSLVFMAVEGFLAVDLEWPVLDPEGAVAGSVSVLLKPSVFLSVIIDPKNIFPTEFWVMQTDGIIVYDQDTEEIGRNLFTDPLYLPFEDLKTLGWQMAENASGKGAYTFFSAGMSQIVRKNVIWTTVGLHGTEWRIVLTQ